MIAIHCGKTAEGVKNEFSRSAGGTEIKGPGKEGIGQVELNAYCRSLTAGLVSRQAHASQSTKYSATPDP
jgi:hypothetical protein